MRSSRRSLLYLPGSNPRFIEKSKSLSCDAIILDLEDSVSPAQKETARKNVVQALKDMRQQGIQKELIVRINDFSSSLAYKDLEAVIPFKPDTIIVPKAELRSMIAAEMYLDANERGEKTHITLVGLIETAKSLLDAPHTAEQIKRLSGFQFGAEDYTKDMGIVRREDNQEVLHAKTQMAILCRAHGIDAIDTPYPHIENQVGLKRELSQSISLGFTGKTAIHPKQIDMINEAFTPTEEEVAYSKRMIEAFEVALKEGRGSVAFEGKMIDAPIVDRAREVLKKAGNHL